MQSLSSPAISSSHFVQYCLYRWIHRGHAMSQSEILGMINSMMDAAETLPDLTPEESDMLLSLVSDVSAVINQLALARGSVS